MRVNSSFCFALFYSLVVVVENCLVSQWNPFKQTHIAALVLARGGSKGIPLKNLAQIGGESLLSNALKTIKLSNVFDSIWVSTDHQLIAEEAIKDKKFAVGGINVHWRAPETATDTASSISAVREFLSHHQQIDVLALIQCTSPFLLRKHLVVAKSLLFGLKKDCVFSVSRSSKLRWQELILGEKLVLAPINFDPAKRPRRQDFKGELVENGMFYFARRTVLEKRGRFQTNK